MNIYIKHPRLIGIVDQVKANRPTVTATLKTKVYTKAKRSLQHWPFNWTHGSQLTFETTVGDVTDTYTNTTPAFDQDILRKSEIATTIFQKVSDLKIWCVNDVLWSYAILLPKFKKFAQWKPQKWSSRSQTVSYSKTFTPIFRLCYFPAQDLGFHKK